MRRFEVAAALLSLALGAGPAFAAGPKSNGAIVVVDDHLGSAASVNLGGPCTGTCLSGSLAQVAASSQASGGDVLGSGYFDFHYNFERVIVFAPGESPRPDSPSGKFGTPTATTLVGQPAVFKVLATDSMGNHASTAAATVVLHSTETANLPQSLPLVSGATAFPVIFASSTPAARVVATPLPAGGVQASTSSFFGIFIPSVSSPTVTISIPNGSVRSTLGGGLSGTAADPVAVTGVLVAIQEKFPASSNGNFWNGTSFSAGAAAFFQANLSNPGAAATNWNLAFPDSQLQNFTSYYVLVKSSNSSSNVSVVETTFTFNNSGLTSGTPGDGQGTATVISTSPFGCQVLASSFVFTAGPNGIAPGGFIAVRVPDGWSRPSGQDPVNDPPLQPGFVHAVSTSPFFLEFNPPQKASATLGDNWIVYNPLSPGVSPGQKIVLRYTGFPPSGPRALEPNLFATMVRGGPGGTLKPIAQSPSFTLKAGPPARLSFSPEEPFALGPLQTAPTMQITLTDQCGVSTVTAAAQQISLFAGQFTAGGPLIDPTAQFYQAGGAALPGQQVVIPVNNSASPPFYYRTSTAGVSFELLLATATFPTVGFTAAGRYVRVLASSASLSSVSVDTGTLNPGQAGVTLPAGAFLSPAFVNFKVSEPSLRWEVAFSTNLGTFQPAVARRFGVGDPGRSVSWNGLVETEYPNRFAAPGTYFVRIRLEGGVVEDKTLQIVVPPTASIYGTVKSTGAGAHVFAQGPGTHHGHAVTAGPDGSFRIFGLQAGKVYNVVATTGVQVNGQFTRLTTSSNGVTAALPLVDIGSIPFPTISLLRVSAAIPHPAPVEFWGGVHAYNADYSKTGFGTLHFQAQSAVSDDGAQSFGTNASTWTAIGLLPGTYDLSVNLHQVGISTTVTGVVVAEGAVTELALVLARKANVAGAAVLPGVPTFDTHVSVQATKAGEKRPSVYGGTFVQAPASSGPYTLYGLDAGTWTVSARAFGFASTSTVIFISSNADVAGLDLPLSQGGVIAGTLTVVGDTTLFANGQGGTGSGGFRVFVNAYNPQTFTRTGTEVVIATATSVSSAAFTIAGVEDGPHEVEAFFQGLSPARKSVTVSGGAAGGADLTMQVDNARMSLTVILPGGPHPASEFRKVSFYTRLSGQGPRLYQDMTVVPGASVQYFPNSAVWVSPPLGPGYAGIEAYYSRTGTFKRADFQLSNNTTAFHTLDLSGSTHSVSGQVSLTGNISFSSASYGVSVSSVAGLLANAKTTDYCLVGSTDPVPSSTFHLELLPIPLYGSPLGVSLRSSSGSVSACVDPKVPDETGFQSANPYHALLAQVAADGTFQFSNVPPGHYLLRNAADVDGDPSNGLELPQLRRLVQVSTDVSGVEVKLNEGVTVSGRLLAPPGQVLSRAFAVSLLDAQARPLKTVVASFNNGTEAPYAFEKVADGQYAVRADDLGFPRSYGARPRTVTVFGLSKTADDMALVQTGVIKGRLAIQQNLSGGTTRQFLLITNNNKNLVPGGFQVRALANPWVQGGFFPAKGDNCGPDGCFGLTLDPNDQFVIEGVLPGTYDVEFESHNDPQFLAGGGVALVSSFLPGVTVSEGRTTDIGTFNILAGAQLDGQVFDAATSSPIANILMEARPSVEGGAHDRITALTDKDGRFTLTGLDPATRFYSVFAGARPEGGGSGGAPQPYEQKVLPNVDISSTSALTFSLSPAPYSVSGRVQGTAGGPPLTVPFGDRDSLIPTPGAVVFFQKVGEIPTRNPVADIEALTAPDGTFTIPSLTAGTYRLTAVAVGYSSLLRLVTISTASVGVGVLQLGRGGTLSGSLRKPDGSSPGQSELDFMVAATDDLSELLFATLTKDPNTKTVSAYEIGGFRAGVRYRLILGSDAKGMTTPDEARGIVFSTTTESRTLDLVLRPSRPFVFAKAKKTGSQFLVQVEASQPLRAKTAADDDLAAILSTFSATGALSQFELFANRSKLTALYTPGVGESSFTLKFNAFTTIADPESLDPVNPEFVILTTVTFFAGIDGLHRNTISNVSGGSLVIEGDPGRITIPSGAFQVDASSSVEVTLQLSSESLAGAGLTGLSGAAANLASLRYPGTAYPSELLSALAATPPEISPFSGFYDVLLPLGVRTALSKPVQMCLTYSEGQDPNELNLYWYNAAANAYILQQDVTGAAPVIDTVNRTKCVNVNHFSTFVLFNTGVAVITGNSFAGAEIEAFNFPNPFDLVPKTVSPIHGAANQTVRGTMIRIALPAGVDGDASIRVFNVAGERVRTIDLGNLTGGNYFYQAWDGRNDSGRDVASGVYIGQIKVGNKSKFIKMALIK